uniref:Uncharacterized protein n=1 Tax=Picea glauca TaxID=3330 RepID=A0A101LUZ4_PICGL|nr:hypothetical protein ABT39_MTgene2206 [Picea glauca]QHR87798.1 hypothetical protein Q903MT_gene1810 [Picea sitchensis]
MRSVNASHKSKLGQLPPLLAFLPLPLLSSLTSASALASSLAWPLLKLRSLHAPRLFAPITTSLNALHACVSPQVLMGQLPLAVSPSVLFHICCSQIFLPRFVQWCGYCSCVCLSFCVFSGGKGIHVPWLV